jgi:hypothetical protein
MRWVVTAIAVLAVAGCIAASAYMNWLFMTSLGKTETDQRVFGMVSLAVSGFLAVLPVLIVWALQSKQIMAAAVGIVLFAVCATVSGSSAIGFAASNRGETVGARETVTDKFGAYQEELSDAEKRLKELPPTRLASMVAQDIEAAKQSRRWLASKQCEASQGAAAREFCDGYFKLKKEQAAAEEKGKLHDKIEKLRGELNALRDKGAGREGDVQAAVIGRVLGIGTGKAQEALALLLAAVVELMAGFGFYASTSHLTHRRDGKSLDQRESRGEGRGMIIDVTPADVRVSAPRVAAAGRRVGTPVAQIAGPRRIKLSKREG